MRKNQRLHERITIRKTATLLSPNSEEITVTIENISQTGLLLSAVSSPIDQTIQYKTKIPSVHKNMPIILTAQSVWQEGEHYGLKFTNYHFNSKESLRLLLNDLISTHNLIKALENNRLQDLFVDKKEEVLDITYN